MGADDRTRSSESNLRHPLHLLPEHPREHRRSRTACWTIVKRVRDRQSSRPTRPGSTIVTWRVSPPRNGPPIGKPVAIRVQSDDYETGEAGGGGGEERTARSGRRLQRGGQRSGRSARAAHRPGRAPRFAARLDLRRHRPDLARGQRRAGVVHVQGPRLRRGCGHPRTASRGAAAQHRRPARPGGAHPGGLRGQGAGRGFRRAVARLSAALSLRRQARGGGLRQGGRAPGDLDLGQRRDEGALRRRGSALPRRGSDLRRRGTGCRRDLHPDAPGASRRLAGHLRHSGCPVPFLPAAVGGDERGHVRLHRRGGGDVAPERHPGWLRHEHVRALRPGGAGRASWSTTRWC